MSRAPLRLIAWAALAACGGGAVAARAEAPVVAPGSTPALEPVLSPPPPVPALAEPGVHPIRWNPAWGEVGTPELVLTGVAIGAAIAGQIIPPVGDGWSSSLGFDAEVRSFVRLNSENERRLARDYSDVLLTSLIGFPVIIDALVVAGWSRQSTDVSFQMLLMDAQVFAVTMAIQGITNTLVHRERPYADGCGGELPANTQDCEGSTRGRSFFSGHTAASFAAAALVCTHQYNLDLYQNPQMGAVICASGFVLAGTTGALRMAGDVHNFSDVLVGAAVGTLVGFGLPWLFHYRFGDIDDPPGAAADTGGPTLQLAPMGLGLSAIGTF